MKDAEQMYSKIAYYAVFVRKHGEWVQQSVLFTDYCEAQKHAKLVRRLLVFVEKTRVMRFRGRGGRNHNEAS